MKQGDRPGLRISAIVVGLLGLGLVFLTGWNWKAAVVALPWVIILLGYGIFGLFGKVLPGPESQTVNKADTPDNAGTVPQTGLKKNTKIATGCAIAFIILMLILTNFIFFTK
jgi:ABC-type uncharacterized transport system permease subunit